LELHTGSKGVRYSLEIVGRTVLIFKILSAAEWRSAQAVGVFNGSEVDRRDGFIHFSTADQLQETAERHFAGQTDLMLLAVWAEALGEALKWEPSRGGDLFPHLYRPLNCHLVDSARPFVP
jgi:uncharacterized protein (DUF952 family)